MIMPVAIMLVKIKSCLESMMEGANSYITKAGTDYEYFDLGEDWDVIKGKYGFTDDDMFKLFNESFLEDGVNSGKTFHFSHNPVGDTGALG